MPETSASPALATAWFLHAAAPDATFQNVQLSLSLGESCPIGHLRDAWQEVITARGILRSSFPKAAAGEILHRHHEAADISWSSLNWTDIAPAELSPRWQALLNEDARAPFDLSTPRLIRFKAIELPGGHCQLLVTFPKLLLDEDVVFHVLCEWLEALQGTAPQTGHDRVAPSTPSPATADWWSRFFFPAPEPMVFEVYPKDLSPAEPALRQEHEVLLDRDVSRELKSFCQRLGLSPRDMFLAVWSLVLSRLSSRGTALLLADSNQGNFLPCQPANNPSSSLETWLRDVARSEEERARNSSISLERALVLAEPSRQLREFPAAFLWAPPLLNDRIHDVFPRWINFDVKSFSRTQFPLTLQVRDGNRFLLKLETDPALCPPSQAEALLQRITRTIGTILENPAQTVGDLSMLTAAESQSLPPPAPAAAKRQPESVELQIATIAARQPDALAITGPNDAALSFAELDSHARSLAAWLRHENLADGWNVAVCLTPTPWLPVAVLGILRAGDTCVPLDCHSAPAWLAGKIESSDVEMIICDSRTAPFFDGLSRRLLIIDQQWETVAPSTGEGGSTTQKNAFLLIGTAGDPPPALRSFSPGFLAAACQESLALWTLGVGDRIPLLAAPGTGAFVETLLCSLLAGATLVLPEEKDPLAIVENGSPTHLRLSQGHWRVLAARLQRTALPKSLRVVCVENTDASAGQLAAWHALNSGHATGIFFYSPAGLSGASIRVISDPDHPPLDNSTIGSPGPQVAASLLDPAGQLLPPHYPGRLEITILQNGPFSLPAWRDSTGMFHLVSAENPAALILRTHPEIFDVHCSVLTIEGRRELGAWVILRAGSGANPAQLLQSLPPNQRPDFLLLVSELPLTPAGNLDEAALPRPKATPAATPSRPGAKSSPPPLPAAKDWQPLILLHKTPDTPVLFLVHDLEGEPQKYLTLAGLCKADWTVYGTTARGLHNPTACHLTVETEAAALVESICLLDPAGPFHLFGYGFGAVLAMEMARQLRIAGRPVPYLALAGSRPPKNTAPADWKRTLARVFSFGAEKNTPSPGSSPVAAAHLTALQNHHAQPLSGPAGIILGSDMGHEVEDAWADCAPEAFVETISCPTAQMLTEPSVKRLAVIMREWMVSSGDEP